MKWASNPDNSTVLPVLTRKMTIYRVIIVVGLINSVTFESEFELRIISV